MLDRSRPYRVAALYVDERGPYVGLVSDLFGVTRDARNYNGPLPIVAHPPCGPWSRLRAMCRRDHERELGPIAVEQVRRFGGVLEHPLGSALWPACGLPLPGDPVDEHGGRSYFIYQGDFGHVAPKPTYLYAVRLPVRRFDAVGGQLGRVERIGKRRRHLTPPQLVALLCAWAEMCAPAEALEPGPQ